MLNKHFKAILLDIDGTIVKHGQKKEISPRVIEAIRKANGKIDVSIVTGRPLYLAKYVLNQLNLHSPQITEGGARIVDGITYKTLFEQLIESEVCNSLLKTIRKVTNNILIVNNGVLFRDKFHFDNYNASLIVPYDMTNKQVDNLTKKLRSFSENIHYIKGSYSGLTTLDITHKSASKLTAMFKYAKLLKISKEEIIAVGDDYNDYPMMMSAGLKIAMGNAIPEIKEIADYIAPSVFDDGLVDVINKFILND